MKKVTKQDHKLDLRIESLTDLVFGLALSIGALLLASTSVTTPSAFVGNILSYAFGFLILVFVWFRYTLIESALKFSTRSIILLNILLLFFVSIEPYLFNILKSPISSDAIINISSSIYAFDMGSIMIILGILTYIVIKQKVITKKLNHYKQQILANFIIGVIFFISILPFFWSFEVYGIKGRFFIWLVSFPIIYIIFRISNNRR